MAMNETPPNAGSVLPVGQGVEAMSTPSNASVLPPATATAGNATVLNSVEFPEEGNGELTQATIEQLRILQTMMTQQLITQVDFEIKKRQLLGI